MEKIKDLPVKFKYKSLPENFNDSLAIITINCPSSYGLKDNKGCCGKNCISCWVLAVANK